MHYIILGSSFMLGVVRISVLSYIWHMHVFTYRTEGIYHAFALFKDHLRPDDETCLGVTEKFLSNIFRDEYDFPWALSLIKGLLPTLHASILRNFHFYSATEYNV